MMEFSKIESCEGLIDNMVEAYAHARMHMIDDTIVAILKARKPMLWIVLNACPWVWIWRLAGVRLHVHVQSDNYSHYSVYVREELLGDFMIRTDITPI